MDRVTSRHDEHVTHATAKDHGQSEAARATITTFKRQGRNNTYQIEAESGVAGGKYDPIDVTISDGMARALAVALYEHFQHVDGHPERDLIVMSDGGGREDLRADGIEVVHTGALNVTRDYGRVVAAYAPGLWNSAVFRDARIEPRGAE